MNRIGILAVILVASALCAWPRYLAATPTSQQVSVFQTNMQNHQEDLLAITGTGKTAVDGNDAEIAINLLDLVNQYSVQLEHIQELLLIDSSVKTPEDRKRIKPIIDRGFKAVSTRIEISLKQVNLSIAHAKHQGIIATAVRLRDHLRELKGVLEGTN